MTEHTHTTVAHSEGASLTQQPPGSPDPALQPRLVVTDLDGSLLDHHSYDFSPAAPWLARLKQLGVPVIPVTSKTRAELISLREALGLTATPFVAENGAVIGLPPGWCHARLDRPGSGLDGVVVKHTGVDVGFIRARLNVWRKRLGVRFTRMSELDMAAVMSLTGLDETRAKAARQREGSEPLIWEDDEVALANFRLALEGDGLMLTQGGRFWHVMGKASDKGSAVDWLIKRFTALRGREPLSLGLGDDQRVPRLDRHADEYSAISHSGNRANRLGRGGGPLVGARRPPISGGTYPSVRYGLINEGSAYE